MTSGDPDRVSDAACALRQTLELGVHHTTLLRAQDGRAHGIAVEGFCNGVGRPFEARVEGGAVWQAPWTILAVDCYSDTAPAPRRP